MHCMSAAHLGHFGACTVADRWNCAISYCSWSMIKCIPGYRTVPSDTRRRANAERFAPSRVKLTPVSARVRASRASSGLTFRTEVTRGISCKGQTERDLHAVGTQAAADTSPSSTNTEA